MGLGDAWCISVSTRSECIREKGNVALPVWMGNNGSDGGKGGVTAIDPMISKIGFRYIVHLSLRVKEGK